MNFLVLVFRCRHTINMETYDGNIFAKNVMKGSNKYCQPFVYKLRFLMNFLAPWGAERNIYISFNYLRLA